MRWLVVSAWSLASACLGPGAADCPGGGVCPPGLHCRLDRGAQVCVGASCGNGVIDPGEACDDGNNDSGDLCPGDCITLPTCGNGELEPGEDCDDGNRVSGDGCQATCRFPVRPPGRDDAAMAYDAERGVLVLFGGRGLALLNDTWEWDGTEWIVRDPPRPLPRARARAAMTYDPVRRRVLLFGGRDVMGAGLSDLWEWDGQAWREIVVTPPSPPPLDGAGLVFDEQLRRAVLFGGTDVLIGSSSETWQWDGIRWERMEPTTRPPATAEVAMAYDVAFARTVLVGPGHVTSPSTWYYGGLDAGGMSQWEEFPIVTPGPHVSDRMAHDRARGKTVLVGNGGVTWEHDQGLWIDRTNAAGPPPRSAFCMTYVDRIEAVVVFGGAGAVDGEQRRFDDLWTWDGAAWRERL